MKPFLLILFIASCSLDAAMTKQACCLYCKEGKIIDESLNSDFFKAVEKAILKNDIDIVTKLFSGAKIPNINKHYEGGRTVLMAAALWGKEAVVRLLIEYGADPNIKDEFMLISGPQR